MEAREATLTDQLLEQWHGSVNVAGVYANLNDLTTNIALFALAAGLVILFVAWVIHTPSKGIKMGKNAAIPANAIVNGFNEAVLKGEMSAKDARFWMLKIGRDCDIPDLVPIRKLMKKLHPEQITRAKQKIKHRLGNGLYYKVKKVDDYGQPVEKEKIILPIPGTKPIQLLTKEDKKAHFKRLTAK